MLEIGDLSDSAIIYYDVVEGRQPLPVCHFSHYEIRNGLDQPFLCHMPIVIGSLAIVIALGEHIDKRDGLLLLFQHVSLPFSTVFTDPSTKAWTKPMTRPTTRKQLLLTNAIISGQCQNKAQTFSSDCQKAHYVIQCFNIYSQQLLNDSLANRTFPR